MGLCSGAISSACYPPPALPALHHRSHRHPATIPLVCSWSANGPLERGFIFGTQLRLGNHSQFQQTGASIRGKYASRTTTAAFDPELHSVLVLASDAELYELSNILYGQSPLSPLLKSMAPGDGSNRGTIAEAIHEQEYGGRDALLERLESRFMFLAADAKATISGRRPTYRDVLLRVRSKLNVPCSVKLSTEDLEAEIFLHLLQDYSSQPKKRQQTKRRGVPYLDAVEKAKGSRFRDNISSAIRLGSEELLTTLLKGSSAVTVSTLQGIITKQLSGKVLVETARYQLAKEALVKGGQAVAAKLESQVAVLAARQTLAGAAARYMTLRSTMMVLGPLLWGTFLADMLIRSIGTDYARVVRAIYAFAQIRLSRTYGWTRVETL
ncbi:uncharacterized protein [Physcomitrium patens]|uniref:Uncharacterized protein n=1 Tax=Physcomitrium patens TaxID=3218 RepID=A0A2K1IGW6_PHYPA|nr:uncharacterized protein LOC112276972 [Physcomitrium patens]PNR28510.1 hypothetical protein PHYPA_029102 [Physcomitrium patens]|eukprot:XP_024364602.1 uncharacterized protein LOC112276972 [Physcomitrella patens]